MPDTVLRNIYSLFIDLRTLGSLGTNFIPILKMKTVRLREFK